MRAEWMVLAWLLAATGCGSGASGSRPIAAGTPCARCGMAIEDLRYACEDEQDGRYRFFDAIECLIAAERPGARVWLADYDTRTLHAAESTWVVRADIASPMGGGYAAFLEREAAAEIAAARNGRVGRLGEFLGAVAPSGEAGSR